MNIYRFETSLTATGGSANSFTLRIPGGMIRQFFIRAGTTTTVFRADLAEFHYDNTTGIINSAGMIVLNYDYHEGEINDTGTGQTAVPFPVYGRYQLDITNASRNDTFNVRIMVEE